MGATTNDTVAFLLVRKKLQARGAAQILFGDELTNVFQWITFTVVCQTISIFGLGSNIVNIMCFVKQGFNDPINVSLLGLAVADIGCLVTVVWTNLCFSPAFIAADLPFEPTEFQFLIGGIPHVTFTRISSWMTALITMERCLCIIAPIKVKAIVTPKSVFLATGCVFVVLLGSAAPVYVVNGLDWKFYPGRNKTLLGLVFTPDRDSVEKVSYIINNFCVPFVAFAVTIVCTIILVVQLHNTSKWRKKSTVSIQANNVSKRNQMVSKMVVMISVLFICCFIPVCVFCFAMAVEPELSVVGKYKNALLIFIGFGLKLESINSASNIFIYYRMSTKYRATLRQLFFSRSK